jgi:hypothetical protein
MNEFIQFCLTRDPRKRPSAEDLLKHPYLLKAEGLRGRELVADLVEKAKTLRQKKKSGQRIDDDFDEDPSKYQVNPESASSSDIGQTGPGVGTPDVNVSAVNIAEDPQDVKGKPIIEARQSYILDEEVLCSDFLGQYLLLGTDKGLLVADLNLAQEQQTFLFCVRGVRFRQLSVLEDYGVMLARCGKNDHVRQYRLSSIRKLIRMVLNGERADVPETGLFHRNTQGVDGSANPLQDFIKIPMTKDSTSFIIERTAGSIFMVVLVKNDMTLFEWAKDPYLRFMKVKGFWLPEQPKFISLFHDGYFVRDILVNYAGEANLVNAEDSKVTELQVASVFRQTGGDGGANAKSDERWRTFEQLPIEQNVFQTMRMTVLRQASVNRKIAAAVSPYQDGTHSVPAAKRRYLATFGYVTYIVDGRAQPVANSPSFRWTKHPTKLLVVPSLYVIGICENSVEICDIKTGEKLQVIQHTASLRFLCDKNGRLVIATNKKRRTFQVFILGATQIVLQQLAQRQQNQHMQHPQMNPPVVDAASASHLSVNVPPQQGPTPALAQSPMHPYAAPSAQPTGYPLNAGHQIHSPHNGAPVSVHPNPQFIPQMAPQISPYGGHPAQQPNQQMQYAVSNGPQFVAGPPSGVQYSAGATNGYGNAQGPSGQPQVMQPGASQHDQRGR